VEVADLVKRAAHGEPAAWGALVDQFARLIGGICRKFNNLDERERRDIFQDTLLVLFRRGLQGFRGSTAPELRSYIAAITRNEALTHLRKRKRQPEVLDSLFLREDPTDDRKDQQVDR